MSSAVRLLVAAGLVLAAGCAPPRTRPAAPTPPAPPARELSARELEALAELLHMEDRRSFDSVALAGFASAPSPVVRRYTALALGRLRDERGLPLLTRLLAHPDTAVAATAAFALGQVGDTLAVPHLVAVLGAAEGGRPSVAVEAALALGKLGGDRARAALDSLLSSGSVQETAAPSVVRAALLAIWKFRRPADLTHISRWAASADPELRWRAAYALVRRPTPAATPLLVRLLEDAHPLVRSYAVRGLTAPLADSSGVGSAATLPRVLAATHDSAYTVRVNAVRALGTYEAPEAVERLGALLWSPEHHLALAAAEGLGRLGDAAGDAAGALQRLSRDSAAPLALRQAAIEALAAPEILAVAAADSAWRLRASAARGYAALGAAYGPELTRLVRDPDGRVAAAALQALVASSTDSLASLRNLLLEAAGAADVTLRATALGALGDLRDPSLLPFLLDAYDRARGDSRNDAALVAVSSIAELEGSTLDPSRAFFARFDRSPDYLVRLQAREAFGDSASAPWGPPLPIDTGRDPGYYRAIVRRWIVPALERGERPRVRIDTRAGAMDLVLFAAAAPLTVDNLVTLTERGYFEGQEWPRVVPNFVVQGGDPRGDMSGGPGYAIRDEINRRPYSTGTLGMALAGPDTGGSQFFVTHSPQPHLDGGYTVFGEVVAGQGVTQLILPGDPIHSIRVIQ